MKRFFVYLGRFLVIAFAVLVFCVAFVLGLIQASGR